MKKHISILLVCALALQSVLVCEAKSIFERGSYLAGQINESVSQAAQRFYDSIRNIGLSEREIKNASIQRAAQRLKDEEIKTLKRQAQDLENINKAAQGLQGVRKWEYLTGAAKRIVAGIIATAILSAWLYNVAEKSDLYGGSLFFILSVFMAIAGLGLTASWAVGFMLKKAGIQANQLRRINSVMKKYTTISDIRKVSLAEAAIIVAAYKGEIALMKQLIKQSSEFMAKPGMWDALTELSSGKVSTEAAVVELKAAVGA